MIAPALRFTSERLGAVHGTVPASYELISRVMLAQVELLWERGVLEYLILSARRPG